MSAMPTICLAKRGTTIIDLCGQATVEEFKRASAAYYVTLPPETAAERAVLDDSLRESDTIARSIRSRQVAAEVLERLGGAPARPGERLVDLKLRIRIKLLERWFPNVYVNERSAL